MQEKISIVMPVKDAGEFLKTCIKSIRDQSYTNWELLAVDDHSSDGSFDYLQNVAEQDSRIRCWPSKGKGIIDALQLGYAQSTGSFVHRMDADDIMPPNKLEYFLQHWQPQSVVTGKVKYFSDEWEVGEGFINYQNWINGLMEAKDFWQDVYMECPIPSPGWFMQKNDFDAIGAFDSNELPEDYDLCFRMLEHGMKVIPIPEVIHLWRDSSTRVSRNNEVYYPMSYYPLKVKYFLKLHRNEKPLVLAGAGKKGKRIAQLLLDAGQRFTWITNNNKKVGQDIYGVVIKNWEEHDFSTSQVIFAVSSSDSKNEIKQELLKMNLLSDLEYYWFC